MSYPSAFVILWPASCHHHVACSTFGFGAMTLTLTLLLCSCPLIAVGNSLFRLPSLTRPLENFPEEVLDAFPLPFLPDGLYHGQNESAAQSNKPALKLFGIKKCPAVLPKMPNIFEVDFLKCSREVSQIRGMKHPEQDKGTDEVILKYGYNLTTYDNVKTDDGYLLTVFRITGGPKSPPRLGKPAVLLHHGMVTSTDSFFLLHGPRNLAFKLADAGYDVWLPNFRGTTYSQDHAVFTTKDDAYWDFSFHEIGVYDLPAVIRFMLWETGHQDVLFVGHSMGGTSYAVGLSELPELNGRIRAGILLGPAIHIGHSFNPLRSFTSVVGTPVQNWIYHAFEGYFDAGNPHWSSFMGWSPADFCTHSAARCGVCDNLAFFLYGFDAPQANFTSLPNVIAKIKNVASLRTVIHFAQSLINCEFRKYDFGYYGNYQRYGRLKPPRYRLDKITAPTYIFYGEGDNFVPPVDIQLTVEAMKEETVREVIKVEWPLFNHIDFVTANDADVLVYDKVIEILDFHSPPYSTLKQNNL